jgi:dTMP kinase
VLTRLDKGVLVALEGIDGAGKTTQSARLAELLRQDGLDVVVSKEPTNGPWGRKLRESAQAGRLSAEEELELFIRDRQEHVDTVIAPALAAGQVVIVDRYYFSTVAYQGARGMDPKLIQEQNEAFAPKPDLLVIIEVPPAIGVQRIRERGGRENHFEQESSLEAVARVFDTVDFSHTLRVDGTLPLEQVTLRITDRLYSGLLSTRHVAPGEPRTKGKDELSNADVWNLGGATE